MQILRDRGSVARVSDPGLRPLLERCLLALADFDDYDLDELVTFVIVQPGDSVGVIDAALGFSVLDRPFELLQDHPSWFEIVYVTGDDGFGFEVFVPKVSGVDPELIRMCAAAGSTPP